MTPATALLFSPARRATLMGEMLMQAALLLELWDSSKPKFDPERLGRQPRPQLPVLPDLEPMDPKSPKDADQSAT